ncbi:MAG: tetratricopeptide repeat protein [Cytophagales bacterium]|nr:tetratricopeptide repeat protein [Cytophagales bacterium]
MKYCAIIFLFFTLSLSGYGQRRNENTFLSEEASMKAEMALIDGEKHLLLENYAKALEMFHVARDINPDNAAIHFKIAEVLFKNKAFNDAVMPAEKAIDLDPKNKFYYLLAADIHTARSDLQSAQKLYEALVKQPNTEDYYVDLALIYEYQGKDTKALEMLAKAQDHFGTNEAMVLEKQKIFLKNGNYEALVPEWERLINEYPGEDNYIFSLVDILENQGNVEEAKGLLKSLVSKDQSNNRANLMLAEIMINQGRLHEAMEFARTPLLSSNLTFDFKGGILNDFMRLTQPENHEYLKTLAQDVAAIHPDDYTAQAFAGDVLYQLNDRPAARDFYVKAIRISPDNYPVWQNILSIESELNLMDSLIVHSEEALEYFPNQAAIYYLGGSGYLQKKEYEKATQLLESGKRYAVDQQLLSIFNGQLGDAYNGMQKHNKSDAAYEASLSADNTNEHVLNNYSYFLTLRKVNLDKALEMSTKLIQLQPEVATYLDTHGWVLFTQGKYKEAKKHLQKAAGLGDDGTVYEHYGDVLYKLGDQDGALEQWEKAAASDDASDLIHKKIADKKFYETSIIE